KFRTDPCPSSPGGGSDPGAGVAGHTHSRTAFLGARRSAHVASNEARRVFFPSAPDQPLARIPRAFACDRERRGRRRTMFSRKGVKIIRCQASRVTSSIHFTRGRPSFAAIRLVV